MWNRYVVEKIKKLLRKERIGVDYELVRCREIVETITIHAVSGLSPLKYCLGGIQAGHLTSQEITSDAWVATGGVGTSSVCGARTAPAWSIDGYVRRG